MSSFTEKTSDVWRIIGQWITTETPARDFETFETLFHDRGYSRQAITRAWAEITALRVRLKIRP